MKKIIIVLLILCCYSPLFAKGSKDKKTELVVFAAASLKNTLTEIKAEFEKKYPNINVIYNFDSSGTLRTQIKEGAKADIFISAGVKQMDDIDAEKGGADFILSSLRSDFLENSVVLAVNDVNKKNIKSFNDLLALINKKDVLIAIGNNDVPVGEYTLDIFKYFNINTKELDKYSLLSYGTNVKEVASQIKNGVVDCGFVYKTDATSENLVIVDTATEDMCRKALYPIAILKNGNKNTAELYLNFLKKPEIKEIFINVGFSVL